MTVDNPDIVDLVTYDRTGAILLVMIEHRAWDGSPERLRQLQEKFDRYLTFIQAGELVERYPFAAGRPLQIELRSYDDPDQTTVRTLEGIRERLEPLSITVVLKKLRTQAGP